jgi:hypothetical protein
MDTKHPIQAPVPIANDATKILPCPEITPNPPFSNSSSNKANTYDVGGMSRTFLSFTFICWKDLQDVKPKAARKRER